MEISLHFLSQNSLQNASFLPCTPTTSLFCQVAVAISADSGPSGNSIGMCITPCPGIACYHFSQASSPTVTSRFECGGMCVTVHHLPPLPCSHSSVGQDSLCGKVTQILVFESSQLGVWLLQTSI